MKENTMAVIDTMSGTPWPCLGSRLISCATTTQREVPSDLIPASDITFGNLPLPRQGLNVADLGYRMRVFTKHTGPSWNLQSYCVD